MPPLTREQLAYRRATTRNQRRHRNRRTIAAIVAPLAVVGVLGIILGLVGGRSADTDAPLAVPITSTPVSAGRPPELVIARGEGVQINVPVDPAVITAAAFHPIGDTSAVSLESSGAIEIHQSDRDGRLGPASAALDVGAPAGTPVYAPVDGVVAAVADYKAAGKIEGFEISIAPDVASQGVLVRVTHLDDPERGGRLSVGDPVQAGETLLGRVRDFSSVGRQELAQFTSDSGNHVHMEVIRTRADLY